MLFGLLPREALLLLDPLLLGPDAPLLVGVEHLNVLVRERLLAVLPLHRRQLVPRARPKVLVDERLCERLLCEGKVGCGGEAE